MGWTTRKTTDQYSLLPEYAPRIPDSWFDRQRSRYLPMEEFLVALEAQWIQVLQAYQGGTMTAEQAAPAITQTISDLPVSTLGTQTDEPDPLMHLWTLFKDALVEWPTNWTPNLIALLLAISKVPNSIYRDGSIHDDDGAPYTWQRLPAIYMVWHDDHWMQPCQIAWRCVDESDRARARDVYIKQQDVASRLVAVGIFPQHIRFWTIVFVLEMDRSPQDKTQESNKGELSELLQADFHLPAVARWMRYNKDMISQAITTGELERQTWREISLMHKKPELRAKRWLFWKERLKEFAQDGPDELVRSAACEALGHLEDIIATTHKNQ